MFSRTSFWMALYFGVLALIGCAPNRGPYGPVGGYTPWAPGYPNGGGPVGYLPVNYPGGAPPIVWGPGTPVVVQPTPNPFPTQPQPPGTPVVLNPVPTNPEPQTPTPPVKPADPGTPTTPVSSPGTTPAPPADRYAKWAPWPLPPHKAAIAINRKVQNEVAAAMALGLPHTSAVHPESPAAEKLEQLAEKVPDNDRRVDGTNSTPGEDLQYHGGKTLQNLAYVNLYVGGEAAGWKLEEVEKIEWAVEQAMKDEHLNNVMLQYFQNKPIGTITHPAHPLTGFKPTVVSRGDIQHYLEYLIDQGYLSNFDMNITIFNFLLPPGTILNDEDLPENQARYNDYQGPDRLSEPVVESDEATDSTGGLGGYHGSIHYKDRTAYYSVEVYSEMRDQFVNGIPVYKEPENWWKNICATLYHELCEYRTDPDVEDAIRDPYNPGSVRFLGWTSAAGEEIGDYPLHAGVGLKDIVKEVPLANGQGIVPVQFNYSNAVHGPEGPIAQPH